MQEFNVQDLLNLSPYGILILFGVWLVRWFQIEFWPFLKQKSLNKEQIIIEAVRDINQINAKLDNLEEQGKEGIETILEDFKDVKNLLTVALKKELK